MLYFSQEVLQIGRYIMALLSNVPKKKSVIEALKISWYYTRYSDL